MKPTDKQVKAVNNIIENRGNVSKAMRDAGYTDATAHNPKNLLESKGFEELCIECGLTEDFLLKELVKDIKDKGELSADKRNRKGEIELGVKIRGMIIDKSEVTTKEKVELTEEQSRLIAEQFLNGHESTSTEGSEG